MLGRLDRGNAWGFSVNKPPIDLAAQGDCLGVVQSSDVSWPAVIANQELRVADGVNRPLSRLAPEVPYTGLGEGFSQDIAVAG